MSDMTGTFPLRHRLNLIWVLMWQNFMPRNQRERAKLAWVVLEPIGYIAVTVAVFIVIGRRPPYGESLALWFATGIVPITFFTQGVQMIASTVWELSAPSRLATIGPFHEAIARSLFKFTVTFIYFFIVLGLISLIEGRELSIYRFDYILYCFVYTTLLIFGWGLSIGFYTIFLPFVAKIYNILNRALVFISGVFFVPSFLPPVFRDWLAWNPILHTLELMRLGFYPDYPSIVYSTAYLVIVTSGVVVLGVALVWRRRVELLG
jgi:capsular polysaccharide transport system permease protein